MKALILAGGHGTRMHPLTLRTPKCLLPIAGKPNITHIINSLNNAGITDVFVSINENQLKINDFLKNKKVGLIIENQEKGKLGSIGGLKYAINKIGASDLIVIGADNFYKGMDLKDFSNSIRKGSATISLYEVPYDYMIEELGIAELKDNVIIGFQEKPLISEAKSRFGSTLVYGLSKDWIANKFPEYLKNNTNMDTIGSMWQYFCEKQKLYGFVFKGLWADIGTPRAYVELNNKVMKEMPESKIHESVVIGKGSVINDNVIIEQGAVIGRDCVIGPGTHIMKDVTIGQGSKISGSIIFENVHIGKNVNISNSVIDGYAVINNNVKISDYSVVGFKSIIKDNTNLIKKSCVWPFITAEGVIDGNITYKEDKNELRKSKYWG